MKGVEVRLLKYLIIIMTHYRAFIFESRRWQVYTWGVLLVVTFEGTAGLRSFAGVRTNFNCITETPVRRCRQIACYSDTRHLATGRLRKLHVRHLCGCICECICVCSIPSQSIALSSLLCVSCANDVHTKPNIKEGAPHYRYTVETGQISTATGH